MERNHPTQSEDMIRRVAHQEGFERSLAFDCKRDHPYP